MLISHLLLRLSLRGLMRLSIDVFEFHFMSLVQDVLAYPVTLSFHRGARLRRNEEQARKHRQADS